MTTFQVICSLNFDLFLTLLNSSVHFSGGSNNTPKSSSELQEALIKPDESKIQRKVSFRESANITSFLHCPECEAEARLQQQRPLTPPLFNPIRSNVPPIQRAVVRTFSIDKLRPLCPVCNPMGETPYPQNGNCGNGNLLPKNNNQMDHEDEVRRLNSELSELQQSLLDGVAELATAVKDHE